MGVYLKVGGKGKRNHSGNKGGGGFRGLGWGKSGAEGGMAREKEKLLAKGGEEGWPYMGEAG